MNLAAQSNKNESLFKQYLESEDMAIAEKIIKSNDNLYSVYCQANLEDEYPKRIELFSKFIQLNPKIGLDKAYMNLGIAFYMTGKLDTAIVILSKAVELNEKEVFSFYFRGTAYIDLEKYDLAIADLNRTITLDPKFYLAYHMRGIVFYRKELFHSAINDYNMSLILNPKYDQSYYMRGFAYFQTGGYMMSIKDWEKAKSLNPNLQKDCDNFILKAYRLMENKPVKEE